MPSSGGVGGVEQVKQPEQPEQLNLDWSLESEPEQLEEQELDLDLEMHDDEASLPLSTSGERRSSLCPSLCGPYGYCSPKKRRWFGILSLLVVVAIIIIAVTQTRSSDENNIINNNEIWTQIRLSRDILPNQYFLNYNINLTTFDFTGTEKIELNIQNPTNTIVIHSRYLNLSNVEVISPTNDLLTVTNTFFYPENDFFVIELSETLQIQQIYTLQLSFHGWLRDELAGLYRSSYITSTGEKRWMATTQFESTDARAAFPCFDEPAFKANFTITITCEPQYHALSNMPIKNQTVTSTSKTFEFDTSVKMSTYLVAMVVSDFVSVSTNTSSSRYPTSKRVSIWTQAEKINQTSVALASAAKILAHYEDLYEAEFPLPKQDLIAIPDFAAGAMENWGLITFRETALLFDPSESSQVNEQRVVVVVAHELAHQWFGDLVTMDWWNELWLNEGFASYVEYDGTNNYNSTWDMFDQFLLDSQHTALTLDATQATHPILQPVSQPSEISQMFDTISYEKGACLIRMMVGFLGNETFLDGLHAYIRNHSFANAASSDLWSAMSIASQSSDTPVDVGTVMDSWTLQAGYPVLSVSEVSGGLKITQQRFFSDQGESTTKWYVYVTSRVPSTPTTTQAQWFKPTDDSVVVPYNPAINGSFIKFDVDENNFYRVNYTATLWTSLTAALQNQDATLSVADRAGLLDDAFALAEAAIIPYPTALNLSKFLSNEPSYVVWTIASTTLLTLGNRIYYDYSYGLYQNYMKYLLTVPYQQVGWNSTGAALDNLKRRVILNLACQYEVGNCRETATQIFDQFYQNNVTIDPNIRDIVYRVAIADAPDSKYFDFLYQHYFTTTVASEKDRIVTALAYTRIPWLLMRLLWDSLDSSKIKSQDTMSMISRVSDNPIGTPLAWDFFRDQWSTLFARYGSTDFSFGNLLTRVTGTFNTQRKYDEVNAFINSVSNLGTASKSAPKALEAIQANINWLKKNEQQVVNWLTQNFS